jgi:hypothetical protein
MLAKVPNKRKDERSSFDDLIAYISEDDDSEKENDNDELDPSDRQRHLEILKRARDYLLETICAQQITICRQLDELLLLMQMPSESVLRVLHTLLLPMGRDMAQVSDELKTLFPEA